MNNEQINKGINILLMGKWINNRKSVLNEWIKSQNPSEWTSRIEESSK